MQFLKNLGAMLYTYFVLMLIGGLLSFLLSLLVALPLWAIIVILILFGSPIFLLGSEAIQLCMFPAKQLIRTSLAGKVMCIISSLLAMIVSVCSTIHSIFEYNAANSSHHGIYLFLQICALLILLVGVIGSIIMLLDDTHEMSESKN